MIDTNSKLIKVVDQAKTWGVPASSLRVDIKAKVLPAILIGGRYYLTSAAIEAYLQRATERASKPRGAR